MAPDGVEPSHADSKSAALSTELRGRAGTGYRRWDTTPAWFKDRRVGYPAGMDKERYPSPEERMPDAPTGDPERLERERESQYEQLRHEEAAERDDLAEDVGEPPPPRDDQ